MRPGLADGAPPASPLLHRGEGALSLYQGSAFNNSQSWSGWIYFGWSLRLHSHLETFDPGFHCCCCPSRFVRSETNFRAASDVCCHSGKSVQTAQIQITGNNIVQRNANFLILIIKIPSVRFRFSGLLTSVLLSCKLKSHSYLSYTYLRVLLVTSCFLTWSCHLSVLMKTCAERKSWTWKHVTPVMAKENKLLSLQKSKPDWNWIRAGPSVPTSDFKSSDLALAESLLFIDSCSSSSLLVDGVLPLDTGPTAGGAAGKKRKCVCVRERDAYSRDRKCGCLCPWGPWNYCSMAEVVLRSNLITWPGVSDLSELLALIQQQSELFNTLILNRTEKQRAKTIKAQLRCLSKVLRHTHTHTQATWLGFLHCHTNIFLHMAFASKLWVGWGSTRARIEISVVVLVSKECVCFEVVPVPGSVMLPT